MRVVPLANVRALVQHEIDESARSDKPSWSKTSGPLQVSVWRERYFTLDSEEYHHRSIHFRIAAEGDIIATGRFVEWRGPPGSDMDFYRLLTQELNLLFHLSVRYYVQSRRAPCLPLARRVPHLARQPL